ncbi:MAG: T9SS type A sorting domain-containing protein [Flavobacteriales bacterium]|nr:T9SS type A sorting domain-containing protein [Flavobacteriales bacterium]
MRKLIVFISLMCCAAQVVAQHIYFKGRYEYQHNDLALNYGNLLLPDGYLLYGSIKTPMINEYSAAFLKIDPFGNKIDSLIINEPNKLIECKSVFALQNGFIAVCHKGTNGGGNRYDPYIIRLNANLDTLWTKTIVFGSDTLPFVSGAMMTRDSNIVVYGDVLDSIPTSGGIMILKIDTLGNLMKFKSFIFQNEYQGCSSVDQTLDGGFIIGAGSTYYHPLGLGYYKQLAIKTDSLFNEQWNYIFGRNDANDGGFLVKAMKDSTIIIYSTTPTQAGVSPPKDWYFRKVTYSNQLIWQNQHGPADTDAWGFGLTEVGDSTFYLFRQTTNNPKPIISRYDASNGNLLWSRESRVGWGAHIGASLNFVPADSGFIISGFYQLYMGGIYPADTGSQDIFVIKTNCEGFADPPLADFIPFSFPGFEVVLDNNTMYYTSMQINWGDGEVEYFGIHSDTLISHYYQTQGTYTVTLIANACGDSDTTSMSVVASTLGLDENDKLKIKIWPNPADDILNIQLPVVEAQFDIRVYDATGRIILSTSNSNADYAKLNINELPSGVYLLIISTRNGKQYFNKLIKN